MEKNTIMALIKKSTLILLSLFISLPMVGQEKKRKFYGRGDKVMYEIINDGIMEILDENEIAIIPSSRGYRYIHYQWEMERHVFMVSKGDKKYGLCDENGREIIPPEFESVYCHRTGGGHPYLIAQKKKNERYVYEMDGRCIYGPIKEQLYYDNEPGKGFYTMDRKYKRHYIGLVIETPEEYNLMARTLERELYHYGEGEGNYESFDYYAIDRGERHGILNLQGDTIISPTRGYTEIKYWWNHFKVEKEVDYKKKKGICAVDGTEIIAPEFDELDDYRSASKQKYYIAKKNNEYIAFNEWGDTLLGPKTYISQDNVLDLLDSPEQRAEARRIAREEAEERVRKDNAALLARFKATAAELMGSSTVGSSSSGQSTGGVSSSSMKPVSSNNSNFAAYKNLDRAYSGYENQLIDMQVNPGRYDASDFSKVPQIQSKMRKIRQDIEKLGFKRAAAPQENWKP